MELFKSGELFARGVIQVRGDIQVSGDIQVRAVIQVRGDIQGRILFKVGDLFHLNIILFGGSGLGMKLFKILLGTSGYVYFRVCILYRHSPWPLLDRHWEPASTPGSPGACHLYMLHADQWTEGTQPGDPDT